MIAGRMVGFRWRGGTPLQCLGVYSSLVALILVACASSPSYQVPPESVADAARFRGTWSSNGPLGDWYSMTIVAVDGVRVAPPLLRSSETNARPLESGTHNVVLECQGSEDRVSYHARVAIDAVFLPRTIYVVKGQIAVDKVVMWLEREDNAEPITAPVAVTRFQNPPTGTIYVPVIVPK